MNSSDNNAESSSQLATSTTETSPSPTPLNDLEQNLVKLDINQEKNSEDDEKTYIKINFFFIEFLPSSTTNDLFLQIIFTLNNFRRIN